MAAINFALATAVLLNWLPADLNDIFSAWSFMDTAIFLLIAWKLHSLSRVAAIAGLALYVAGYILLLSLGITLNFLGLIIATTVTIAFINSVRGTFAYHRLK